MTPAESRGRNCFDNGCGGCDECMDYENYDDEVEYTVRRPMPGDGGKSDLQRMWLEYLTAQRNPPTEQT